MQDMFVLSCGALPPNARVMGFTGHEAIGTCYRFEILVAIGDARGASVDLSDVVGSRAALTIDAHEALDLLHPKPPYVFAGILSSVELVNDYEDRSVFKLTMVPELWRLDLAMHSRIFTQKTIPEIIGDVLSENVIDSFELRLTHTYPVEDHVAQYKESDLAFVQRWMEHEGMYYFFEHSPSGEKLVIADDKSAHHRLVAGQTVRFSAAGEKDMSAGESLHRVALKQSALPALVRVHDYDYAKPALEVSGSSQVSSTGLAEWSLYGDRFFTPGQAKQQADLRSEAFKAKESVLTASGTALHLRTGYLFELVEHPRPQLDAEYLVTEVDHIGRQVHGASELDALIPDTSTQVYRVKLKAISAKVQWRTDRVTPWPRIHCFENAIVDGAASTQYAQIDDQGRYSIKFKFDEGPLKGGKASTWVRMAQPHGGSVEGFHFPLRKGTEVLISFLGGDPDRPVIAAVLPNATTPSPITAANNTKNIMRTGGNTYTEIEDQAGGQYMKQYTPVANTMLWMGHDGTSPQGHNVELSTDGSGLESFGTYFDRFVGSTKNEHVVGDVTRGYDSNYMTKVVGDVVQSYVGNQTTDVTGDVNRNINGSLTESVIGVVTQSYLSTYGQTIKGDVSQVWDQKHTLSVTGDQTVKVTGATTHTFDAGLTVTVNAATSSHIANVGYELEVKPDATMHATENFSIRGDVTAKLSAPKTAVNGDDSVAVGAGSTITISSKAITVNGTDIIKLSGPSVIQIVGGDITVSGGNISIAASANLIETATGTFTMTGTAGAIIAAGPSVDVHGGVIKLNS